MTEPGPTEPLFVEKDGFDPIRTNLDSLYREYTRENPTPPLPPAPTDWGGFRWARVLAWLENDGFRVSRVHGERS